MLITIGPVTGVSITALFTGGLLPGAVLGALLCTLVWWRYRNEDLIPDLDESDSSRSARATARRRSSAGPH